MRAALDALEPYKVKSNKGFIRLDNNESFLNVVSQLSLNDLQRDFEINRYPSDAVEGLIQAYSQYIGFPASNILAGNGSDEWISLICQLAINPGDPIFVVDPDFSMYEKNALIMGANVYRVALNGDFSLPIDQLIADILKIKPKCLFLSNPNNPTGSFYSRGEIQSLTQAMKEIHGYLILDEAYIEFAGNSYCEFVLRNEHVIVLRTASKALGMAGLRLGFLLANDRIIENISRIKPPYNVNQLSAVLGARVLSRQDLIRESLIQQKEQIADLKSILEAFVNVNEKIILYPSQTNFFLVEMDQAKELYDFLYSKHIKIRYFGSGRLKNAIRISIGTKVEMAKLRQSLNEWSQM
jgi:histidinol-phosphate aminotransferase